MHLRKPEGIEYQFNTNALPKKLVKEGNTYKLVLDRRPELDSEEAILRLQITSRFYGTFYSNFISQVCLDYEELQQNRHMAVGGKPTPCLACMSCAPIRWRTRAFVPM